MAPFPTSPSLEMRRNVSNPDNGRDACKTLDKETREKIAISGKVTNQAGYTEKGRPSGGLGEGT